MVLILLSLVSVQEPWISATPCSKQGPTQLSEVKVFKDAIFQVFQEELPTLPGEDVLGGHKLPITGVGGGSVLQKASATLRGRLGIKDLFTGNLKSFL